MIVEFLRDALAGVLIVGGGIFVVIGAIGLNRMPDVFTRMHATSVSDTLGVGLMIAGMIVEAGFSLVAAKLFFLLFFLWFTGPVATHALARAALFAGIKPVLAPDSPVAPDVSDTAKGGSS